ncbi:hypothetical protein BLA18112_02473 [Burkholderia lata]|uniref:Cyclopropane fatty acid synthase n=1 Tax=Burkholderia lata (strain ATCC 17760 / DSM 23089 / LMG 22485 / NCIMB 9086 / R18194 / 383) TaxID=482957 RepID=A0A6P2V528_BURL3|nr:DUF1365 domain-containing protein [Burkholderia lata]VWC78478.1 hypothetical protein BLA18112_02473 [Burkholderia lata]
MNARGESVRLLVGHVVHERLRPVRHAFRYALLQVACDVGRLETSSPAWFGVDRWRPLGIAARDYGPGDGSPLAPWMRARLAEAGIPADGEIWLQTIPRLFGYAFNPVSFWYCHDREGRLRALYADVRNTFGARHGYLLSAPGHAPIDGAARLTCRKTFHVSPFCLVTGEYRFRVVRDRGRWIVGIDYGDEDGLLLRTTIAMRELREPRAWWRFVRHPLDAVGTLWRIYWQALRLARKRVPFHGRTPLRRAPLVGACPSVDGSRDRRGVDTPPPPPPRDARP